MDSPTAERPITIVTACMCAHGSPTFALTEVAVTQEELENGVHYYLAEAELQKQGYEEPYVHFDAHEAPPFLHDAVRALLHPSPEADEPIYHSLSETRS